MLTKRLVYALADSPAFTGWVSVRGMRWGFARRFIAGETLEEAMPAVQELRDRGMRVTLDYLGESVHDEQATRVATDVYCEILDELRGRDNVASISLKPTQVGLSIAGDLARENIARIAERARDLGNFVRIDMEDSSTTEATIEVYKSLRPRFPDLGAVVQAYLYRTEQDVRAINAIGGKLRLCKGAYQEPATVAFQDKAQVDANYVKLAELLLRDGTYPAFATHDHRIIDHIIRFVSEHGIAKEAFEFQMLYGVRRDYQQEIVDRGYTLRVYVPFGREWCPYFMRRIAERPANGWFVARALLGS